MHIGQVTEKEYIDRAFWKTDVALDLVCEPQKMTEIQFYSIM